MLRGSQGRGSAYPRARWQSVSGRLSHDADGMREKRLRIRELKLRRERVDALRRAGAIAWSRRRLRPAKPAGKVRGNKTVADLVVENRD